MHTYTHIHVYTGYYHPPRMLSFGYRLSESNCASYSWKSSFTAIRDRNTAQYRRMLEYAENTLAYDTDPDTIFTLAMKLQQAGLITEHQIGSSLSFGDTKAIAAILIGLVTIKVYSNSENFNTFLNVLKEDEATYGHILAEMEGKGVFIILGV